MRKKTRKDIVYSTNPDFSYDYEEDLEEATLSADQQQLKVMLDRKQRKGKTVTLVEGFVGTSEDLDSLAKQLKRYCGVGGNAKSGKIIVQGDNKEKILKFLKAEGYRAVGVGG